MRLAATAVVLTAAAALAAPGRARAQGSNLGSYGAQFVPGVIAGKVTSDGVPVAGARVETIAGQFTTTDANGDYVLLVDLAGIHDVRVTSATRVAGPLPASVTPGATTTLNFTTFRARPRPWRRLPAGAPAASGARP
jgi:hypothetical protein